MPLSPERQTLLEQERDAYLAKMEAPDSALNYAWQSADRLLALEAINDWSGRTLAEGGDVMLTVGCDDPCCATYAERDALLALLHKSPVMLYPVSGFGLSDTDDLTFSYSKSSFRMPPQIGGTTADGIRVAEKIHIDDVDLAMHLWVTCATESCMAYLCSEMDKHNLHLEAEDTSAIRGIVKSSIQDRFSQGQIWNAMWRSVKDAAALSTRQYYNSAKAAKTLPRKIDSVLTQAAESLDSFDAYDRVKSNPIGAVLTLFLHRFGIHDRTTGAEVRSKLSTDAALSSPKESTTTQTEHSCVKGSFYFSDEPTPLDQLILSCFSDIKLDVESPTLEDDQGLRRIDFSLKGPYSFDKKAFGTQLLPMLGAVPPTREDISRHELAAAEAIANGEEFVDASGRQEAFIECLTNVGIPRRLAISVYYRTHYPSDPSDVVRLATRLPLQSAIAAVRWDGASIYAEGLEHSSELEAGGWRISIPEINLEPAGDDRAVIEAIASENYDRLAAIISTGFCRSISSDDPTRYATLLRMIARQMTDEAYAISPDASEPR